MSDSPFPELPPPPDDPGEYLTFFECDVISSRIDSKDGALVLLIKAIPEHKYRAMPLTDIRGRRFNVTFHARRGKKPLVSADGKATIYALRENRERRQAERAARTTKKKRITS